MMTVDPPEVHPSLGDIALMHGVATGNGGYKPAVKHLNQFVENHTRESWERLQK